LKEDGTPSIPEKAEVDVWLISVLYREERAIKERLVRGGRAQKSSQTLLSASYPIDHAYGLVIKICAR
tara:strand:- start:226 stop:429 length:204 start_codon:yes stop_codon:yes gene_type:complete